MEYGSDDQFALKCQVTGAEEKLASLCKGLTIWLDLPNDDPQAGVTTFISFKRWTMCNVKLHWTTLLSRQFLESPIALFFLDQECPITHNLSRHRAAVELLQFVRCPWSTICRPRAWSGVQFWRVMSQGGQSWKFPPSFANKKPGWCNQSSNCQTQCGNQASCKLSAKPANIYSFGHIDSISLSIFENLRKEIWILR